MVFAKIKSPMKKFKYPLLGLFVVAAIVASLELTDTTHWFHKPAAQVVTAAGKTLPKAEPNVSGSSPDTPLQPRGGVGKSVGGGTDTGGTVRSSTDPSRWITSKSGNITVQQPLANAMLENGAVLSGTAKVDTIHFRLIDNKVGVIAEGTLNVVEGKFSGTLHFTPNSSTGRLDVFSTDASGVELNEIQIGVQF